MTTTFVLFILAAVGMTHVIVDGNVAEPFRRFLKWITSKLLKMLEPLPNEWHTKTLRWFAKVPGEVVDCHQCSGFWCGMICGYILISGLFWQVVMCGFASSIVSLATAYILTYLQARSMVDVGPQEEGK